MVTDLLLRLCGWVWFSFVFCRFVFAGDSVAFCCSFAGLTCIAVMDFDVCFYFSVLRVESGVCLGL